MLKWIACYSRHKYKKNQRVHFMWEQGKLPKLVILWHDLIQARYGTEYTSSTIIRNDPAYNSG